MPHSLLSAYLSEVEDRLERLQDGYVEQYSEEILAPQRVNLRVRIRFVPGPLLQINEALVAEDDQLLWLDYRYHCQDAKNRLIFRYDSTPHFPDLDTFPHHKHLSDRVEAASKPTVLEAIEEAQAAGSVRDEEGA